MEKRNLTVLLAFCLLTGCGEEFLDIKRDKKLVVPETISDYQGLLDDAIRTMNTLSSHELSIISSDEFYVKDGLLETLPNAYEKNAYVWASDVFQGEQSRDWNWAFRRILYANTAINGVEKIKPESHEKEEWNNVMGSGLFFRALNYYNLVQLFCDPYDPLTAQNSLGLPLRLEPDINLDPTRSTLEETYSRIIKDLNDALPLLPDKPVVKFRPSKAAVYALFSRVYLQFGQYQDAERSASKALLIQRELLNFNELDPETSYTFPYHRPEENPEIIFYSFIGSPLILSNRLNVDTVLLNSYSVHDLRPGVYFRTTTAGRTLFKGSYASDLFFTGFAVDELLLTRAECYARLGRVAEALTDLNNLLQQRYREGVFQSIEIDDSDRLLHYILEERRKELLFRGIRWEDLRRLNKEERFKTVLYRNIDGRQYELRPNDPRYVMPIPDNEVLRSGIKQNER